MDIPKGVRVCCAADMLEYDERKALNLRTFFRFYKDDFPMLMVIIGGHYGDTRYDCYDNLQVLRVHCYTSQPRVVIKDTRESPVTRKDYVTIPVDTRMKFCVVQGHSKTGKPQRLSEILNENENLPLLLQFACDPSYPIRVGMSRHTAKDFPSVFVTERYTEHFFIMNCIDGSDLKMNKQTCMACLSEDLEATPVTGFKYKSKAEFDEYCRQLSEIVATSGEVYDRTSGNTDFSEYSTEEMRKLLEVSEDKTGAMMDPEGLVESEDDEYEEFPPMLPPRHAPTPTTPEGSKQNMKPEIKHENKHVATTKSKHPKSPHAKLPDKESKGGFGFFKKKSKEEHGGSDGEAKQTREEKEKSNASAHTSHAKSPKSPKLPPRRPTHKTKDPQQTPGQSIQSHITQADAEKGYVSMTKHTSYQNTKIGRATVKPMPREIVPVKESHEDDIKKETKEEDEDSDEYDYPYVGDKFPVKDTTSLQQKITRADDPGQRALDNKAIREGTDQDSSYYLEPTPARLCSDHPTQKENEVDEQNEDTSVFDASTFSIEEVGKKLTELKLGQYVEVFKDNQVDGAILTSLSVEDFVQELGLKKLEAVRLHKFASSGHIPR